ncbi:hypothetical protein MRB53_036038 [Persea americana]|uniref:Uncharacterized protein n=1 Tax=Persea americana TaxID=3435 RepID=A0ACC2K6D4_PERAE|nr:hypothetical protein MRB53_036038 [Persea americana]
MASVSSECWENAEIDGALLKSLLEEPHVEDGEDERLGCVIESLEAEIGNSGQVESQCGNYDDWMDYGQENVGLDGDDYSRLMCHIDDPFDWVNMISHCDDIGNWYMQTGTNEVGMVEVGDVRDYYYYGDTSMEHDYIPLWQES